MSLDDAAVTLFHFPGSGPDGINWPAKRAASVLALLGLNRDAGRT